ncbi:MAG: SpoIID/LytB domain-containing protein [Cyanobacteria bacterium P01_D01_bin.156]
MSFCPNHIRRLALCGMMAATSWVVPDFTTYAAATEGQPTNAQTQQPQAEASRSQTYTSTPVSNPDAAIQSPSEPEVPSNKSGRSKKSAIAPIEPFIKADAIALGQWLMTKRVKSLISGPDAEKSSSIAQTTEPSAPSPTAKAAAEINANKDTTAIQPPQPQAALPQVNLKALPPEPSESPTIDGYTEMRVAIAKNAPTLAIAASAGGALISTSGELIQNLPANLGYQVSADSRGLFLNGEPIPTAVWLEPDNDGYIAVGDRWYRGRLLLLWQDSGVMAVNHVLLRDYLYSVVGAEMSASWSLEALKAQAVAARSYAIVHTVRHQNRTYDLDDTQRYQVYKGITTEASSTQQAVHETAGEFISYDGGIVESLYAANQDIVDDAHSGYGMSQTGALDLAEQGYQYYEILSAYYPDTSVGRIDIGD